MESVAIADQPERRFGKRSRRSVQPKRPGVEAPSSSPPGRLRQAVGGAWRQFQRVCLAVLAAWDRFWFSARDPQTLGLMRILVGGMLVYTHLVWGSNLQAFFGSQGWNSPDVLAVVQDGQVVPSFWWYVPDAFLLPVHCVCIAVLGLFWLGVATRITSVMSFVITVSYCYRAHMANFGLDQINAILCLYLCIGPSGATLSVDRLFRVWHAKRKATISQKPFHVPIVPPSASANLAIRLIQIHFCVLYTYAGLSKLQGPAWWSGEAVWMAFANLEYQSFDMTWVAWYPWISDLMTHTTIIWEVSFAALVWVRPVRPIVLGMGFLMHAGIGGMMGMWTFGLIMIFGHIAFWPRHSVAWVCGLVPSAARLLRIEETPTNKRSVVATERNDSRSESLSDQCKREIKPALLCVDRGVSRRLSCLGYFLRRGFRCMVTDDVNEAHAVCKATSPDAVVILGAGMDDDELQTFQSRYEAGTTDRPLFMVLSKSQSHRLTENARSTNSHVLSGEVSLGTLRREILATLKKTDPAPATNPPARIRRVPK